MEWNDLGYSTVYERNGLFIRSRIVNGSYEYYVTDYFQIRGKFDSYVHALRFLNEVRRNEKL